MFGYVTMSESCPSSSIIREWQRPFVNSHRAGSLTDLSSKRQATQAGQSLMSGTWLYCLSRSSSWLSPFDLLVDSDALDYKWPILPIGIKRLGIAFYIQNISPLAYPLQNLILSKKWIHVKSLTAKVSRRFGIQLLSKLSTEPQISNA